MLYALGIPGIGYVNARALASHFGSIDAPGRARDQEEIEEVEGIGPCSPATIRETLDEQRNRQLIDELRGGGPATSSRSARPATARRAAAGKTFVLTGTLKA